MSDSTPTRTDRFSFSLPTAFWHSDSRDASRPSRDPAETLHRLAQLGAYGVSISDDGLTDNTDLDEREKTVRRLGETLDDTGLVVTTATTDLFAHPIFAQGALAANDRDIRRYALRMLLRSVDLAAELGAATYVLDHGHELAHTHTARTASAALDRYREALNLLCAYAFDQAYPLRFALGAGRPAAAGDRMLPTVGHALAFICSLDDPDRVGVSHQLGQPMSYEVTATPHDLPLGAHLAPVIQHGKLLHLDLNVEPGPRFDAPLADDANTRAAFWTVDLLESATTDCAALGGVRHFVTPAAAPDADDPWASAAACVRNYRALRERAHAFRSDPDLVRALAAAHAEDLAVPTLNPHETPEQLCAEQIDVRSFVPASMPLARLSQLATRHLASA